MDPNKIEIQECESLWEKTLNRLDNIEDLVSNLIKVTKLLHRMTNSNHKLLLTQFPELKKKSDEVEDAIQHGAKTFHEAMEFINKKRGKKK
jgi:hypothetical protein